MLTEKFPSNYKHMKLFIFFFSFFPFQLLAQKYSSAELTRFRQQAKHVTIIRDNYGIAHIYGKTDADAAFGMLYAQCEDNFKRVELNVLENLGRKAEATGIQDLYNDLQMRLIYDSVAAIKEYNTAPAWFKALLESSSDAVNYFLYKNPQVKPAVLTRFQPWYSLMRTNGSISATNTGGITAEQTKSFYDPTAPATRNKTAKLFTPQEEAEINAATGSNGFVVGPSKSASGNAILYINPHVTFYFRSETHMVSEEGLNVYGAATWGQFFIFQGFNANCGWMHTSGHADLADVYEETIKRKGNSLSYKYENGYRPVTAKNIQLRYKEGERQVVRNFTGYYTHHGPVMGAKNEKFLSLRENNRSMKGLMQSWLRTKADGFKDFEQTMAMRSNTSDNTVFADDKGNIAYWHGNFIPRRDPKYDWSRPVSGTTRATEWQGIHELSEIVHVYNPATGYIQSCNSTPYTASGSSSPDKTKFPLYMAPDGEDLRSLNAIRLLSSGSNFTIDKMISAGYDTHLSVFDILLPELFAAYGSGDGSATASGKAIELLKDWNRESSASSVATTIAIEWATKLMQKAPEPVTDEERSSSVLRWQMIAKKTSAQIKMQALEDALRELEATHGTWKIPWGEINRYQRLNADIIQKFDDAKPSYPVGLASSAWGSLPSYVTVKPADSKKRYGYNGNSFVASVEFGKRVKAKSILTGGQGADPASPHFLDQADGYINGKFKEVLFYKEDVMKNKEREYRPGE